MEQQFNHIYNNQKNGNFSMGFGKSESLSGPGSSLENTEILIRELPNIFKKYNIKTMFDIPCGDFFWMKNVINNTDISYIGGDIVEDLVIKNKEKYNCNFVKFDICKDKIPDNIDLIFIRDLFVHFRYNDINLALDNIKKSKVKYIMTTTFINRKNSELPYNNPWRPLCFFNSPFNFPKPIEIINEICMEDYPNNLDKSLALWDVKML